MAAAMGIPVPLVHTTVFAIGAAMAAASGVLFGPLGGVTQDMGFDFTLAPSSWSWWAAWAISGAPSSPPSSSACWRPTPRWWYPRPGRHRVLRGSDPHAPHPAHGALRAHAQMSAPRRDYGYWIGFAVVVALLCGGSPRAAGVLGPLRHRDPDLGAPGHVLGHPHRLYGDGLLRPFGLLRAGDVRSRRRAPEREAAESLAGPRLRAGGVGGGGGLRRLLRHAPARHLLLHHHPGLLPDLLRHHLHLDRGDRRGERADLQPPPLSFLGALLGALHARHPALVRAGGGGHLLPPPAPHHPVALRQGAPVDPGKRAAHARHRLLRRALQDRGGDALRGCSRGWPGSCTRSRTSSPPPISSSSSSPARW